MSSPFAEPAMRALSPLARVHPRIIRNIRRPRARGRTRRIAAFGAFRGSPAIRGKRLRGHSRGRSALVRYVRVERVLQSQFFFFQAVEKVFVGVGAVLFGVDFRVKGRVLG